MQPGESAVARRLLSAPGMRRLACLLVIVFATTSPARADGLYFTESLGGADVKNELSAYMGSAMRLRVGLGYRHRHLALEVWAGAAFDIGPHQHHSDTHDVYRTTTGTPQRGTVHSGDTSLAMYGLDVKYLQPIAPALEIYLRGGMSHGFAAGIDASGRGLGVGAGIQLKGKVPAIGFLFWPLFFTGLGPKVTAAVYVETGYEFFRLHGPRGATDAELNQLMVGFAVGSDF